MSLNDSRIPVRTRRHSIPPVRLSRIERGAVEIVQNAEVDVPEVWLTVAPRSGIVAERLDFFLCDFSIAPTR